MFTRKLNQQMPSSRSFVSDHVTLNSHGLYLVTDAFECPVLKLALKSWLWDMKFLAFVVTDGPTFVLVPKAFANLWWPAHVVLLSKPNPGNRSRSVASNTLLPSTRCTPCSMDRQNSLSKSVFLTATFTTSARCVLKFCVFCHKIVVDSP